MLPYYLLPAILLLEFFNSSASAYRPLTQIPDRTILSAVCRTDSRFCFCTNSTNRRSDVFVFVAHCNHGRWNCTLRAIETLSSCGISNVIVDLRTVQNSDLLPFWCRSRKPAVALNCAPGLLSAGIPKPALCGSAEWLDLYSGPGTSNDVISDDVHDAADDWTHRKAVYRAERKLRVATLPVR